MGRVPEEELVATRTRQGTQLEARDVGHARLWRGVAIVGAEAGVRRGARSPGGRGGEPAAPLSSTYWNGTVGRPVAKFEEALWLPEVSWAFTR